MTTGLVEFAQVIEKRTVDLAKPFRTPRGTGQTTGQSKSVHFDRLSQREVAS